MILLRIYIALGGKNGEDRTQIWRKIIFSRREWKKGGKENSELTGSDSFLRMWTSARKFSEQILAEEGRKIQESFLFLDIKLEKTKFL